MLCNLAGNVIPVLCLVLIFCRFWICQCSVLFALFFSEKLMRLLPDLWFLLQCVPGFVFNFLLLSLIFCLDLEFDLL